MDRLRLERRKGCKGQVQLREKRRMYKTGVKVIGEGWIEQVQFSEKRECSGLLKLFVEEFFVLHIN